MNLSVLEINTILSTLDIQIEGFKTFFRETYDNGDYVDDEDVKYYKSLLKLRKKFEKCEVFINKRKTVVKKSRKMGMK